MNNKKLFLVGIMTAMILSSSTAFAQNNTQGNIQAYYKSIMRYEMKDLSEKQKKAYVKEILDQEVKKGTITEKQAQQALEDLKEDIHN